MHSRSPRRDRRMSTLVALSISALAFTGCAGGTAPDSSTAAGSTMPVVQDAADLVPAAIKDKGVLTVVMPTNEPPMQFYKQGTKDMTGVNADIARLLAGALGLGIDIQIANFDALIPGLAAGRYDATVSSMTPTEERMQTLDFVEYMNIGSAVGALEETDVSIDDMCGRSVALLSGSYQLTVNIPLIDEACTSGGEEPVDVMVFAETRQVIQAVTSGRADAAFADSTVIGYAAGQNPGFVVKSEFDSAPVAVGIPHDTGLLEPVTKAMEAIIDSPEYIEVLRTYGLESGAITEVGVNVAQ